MRTQRILAMIGIIGITLLLAFPLRDAVFRAVIVPLAYILWVLSLAYHAVHQTIWWAVALLFVLFLLSRSLLPRFKLRKRIRPNTKPIVGQVENLALWLKKTERGTYFKWLVANRLGRIANQILTNRSTGRKRSFFDPLIGPDWVPDPHVQSYLESGLQGSFADYPQKSRFFSTPVHTPMDHDVSEVIQYLESQVENK